MRHSKLYAFLIVIVYLAAHGFFNPLGLIPVRMSKMAFYVSSLIVFIYAFSIKGKLKIQYPKKPYFFLLLGILFSSFMATSFHNQSFSVSFVAVLPYFFGYLFFYLLSKFQLPIEKVEKMLRILTICSFLMYIVNLVNFPNKIFGESMSEEDYDMSRGFARLGVPMIEVVVTYFLFCINRWIDTKKKKYIIWIVATSILIFMSLTRQVIAIAAIMGILFILQKAKLYKKIAAILFCIFLVYYVLPNIPMVDKMLELSENQFDANKYNEEDIRITAWRFYTTDYQTNEFTPILGNGVPSIGNSTWGDDFLTTVYTEYGGNGCYAVDVGWAGFFWYFGAVATIALLVMFIKAIVKKKSKLIHYTTYSLLFIALTSIASGPILNFSQITSFSLIFYIIYAFDATPKVNKNNSKIY